jgi:TonB family protein
MYLTWITGFFLFLGLTSAEGPNYPPYAYKGGVVVAVLHFANGLVKDVSILYGEEPFLSASMSALKSWRFDADEKGPIQVVVQFRHPELDFPATNKQTIPMRKPPIGLPYPQRIIQPTYPLFAEGGGSVIIRARISEQGSVSQTEVLQSLGILTDTALTALKQWKFLPARNRNGKTVPSDVYVVMVFRVPVIAPESPPE